MGGTVEIVAEAAGDREREKLSTIEAKAFATRLAGRAIDDDRMAAVTTDDGPGVWKAAKLHGHRRRDGLSRAGAA